MNLPNYIEIQVVDDRREPYPIANILFGLKLFNHDFSWHNYSAFKTDSKGHVHLTQQEIVNNTELKWQTNVVSRLSGQVEIYAWEGLETENMVKMTQRLIELYDNEKFIIQDLKNHKVSDEDIPNALKATQVKAVEDKLFFNLIKDAVNNSVSIQPSKINDVWVDSSPKKYEFTVNWQGNAS